MISRLRQTTHGIIAQMRAQALGEFWPIQRLRTPRLEQILMLRP